MLSLPIIGLVLLGAAIVGTSSPQQIRDAQLIEELRRQREMRQQ